MTVSLLRQILLQGRPALGRFLQARGGIGGEGVTALLAAEQIEPLSRDQPEPRIAGDGDAAGQIDRVVAAELRAINVGMGDKGGAIALVAETPDGACLRGLEVLAADLGAGVDEIGDGVEPLDRQARKTVHDHPLGGGGLGGGFGPGQCAEAYPNQAGQRGDQGYSAAKACYGPSAVSFLPLCRHSWCGYHPSRGTLGAT